MTKIKIFISSDLYFGQSTGYLFGYVTQLKESLTFYLLRSHSVDRNRDGNGQLFGEICDVTDCTDTNVKNSVNFVQFVKGTNNILLNRVTINRKPDVYFETVQIILYDHIKWVEASADCNSVDAMKEDCIKCLSFFINEEFNKSRSVIGWTSRWNWNTKLVRFVMFAVMSVLNMINKLAVVKHMMDWYHCLNSGLYKKLVYRTFSCCIFFLYFIL